MDYNLRRLQVLEAVYRHRSVNRAAVELEITASAVSHQLRKLGEDVGEKLVEKDGRGIAMTEAGARLAETLTSAFAQIERSVSQSIGREQKTLRLAVCSSFGPGWLIRRLGDFRCRHADIELQLRMYARDPQLTDAVADAFVTAYPLETGFWSMALFDEVLVPVLASNADPDLPLITTDLEPATFAEEWREFEKASATSFHQLHDGKILQCTHYLFALEFAKAGLGIALVPDFLARDDLDSGRLRTLSPATIPAGRRYYLCVKSARRQEAALASLADWFEAQVKTSPPNIEQDSAMQRQESSNELFLSKIQ